MRARVEFRSYALSIALHALALALLLLFGGHRSVYRSEPLVVTLENPPEIPRKPRFPRGKAGKPIDLRPGFIRDGIFARRAPLNPASPPLEQDHSVLPGDSDAADLMAGDLKAADIFDSLAENIGVNLDYPDVLVEEGIEGTASVDLYFDSRGLVDENRSEVEGDHASLRGEMIRAVRAGILSWYKSDAARLSRDEYRNQHFRADFTLSYSPPSEERTDKLAAGSYHFLRKKQINTCLYPGAIDLACTAMKIAGFVQRHTSDKYKVHVAAVMDVLDDFDARGLRGIDADIRAGVGT